GTALTRQILDRGGAVAYARRAPPPRRGCGIPQAKESAMRLVVAALVVFGATAALADDKPAGKASATEVLKAGLAKAKAEGKVVFLVFGSPGCGWCKLLEKYH